MSEADQRRVARNQALVRGCLIAVAAVCGLVLLVVAVVGVLAWRWSRTPEGQETISRVSQGVDVMTEAMAAPGVDALKRLGCETAMVMDMEQAAQVIAPGEILEEGTPRHVVLCQRGLFGDLPTCDEVARAYVSALGGVAEGSFQVLVQRQNDRQAGCSRTYLPDGTLAPEQLNEEAR